MRNKNYARRQKFLYIKGLKCESYSKELPAATLDHDFGSF